MWLRVSQGVLHNSNATPNAIDIHELNVLFLYDLLICAYDWVAFIANYLLIISRVVFFTVPESLMST